MLQRTFSIIKPDAVKRNLIGEIVARLEKNGLQIVASKMIHLSQKDAAGFYAEHEGRPFYPTLIEFMTSGPVIVQVLEGEEAIANYRKVMGATDPEQADEGTIRKDFALTMQQNSVHGSDSPESANREISFFFSETEICPRPVE